MKIKRVLTCMLSASMLISGVAPVYAINEEINMETSQINEEFKFEETIESEAEENAAYTDESKVQDIQLAFNALDAGNTQKITVVLNHTEGIKSALLVGNAEDKGVRLQYESSMITDNEVVFEIEHDQSDWYAYEYVELHFEDDVKKIDLEAYDHLRYIVTDQPEVEANEGVSLFSLRKPQYTGVNGDDGKFVVVLDPGHDPVCNTRGVVNGVWETELNWKIAEAMKEALETYANVEVYINREWNECPEVTDGIDDLEARVVRAANVDADLFISLHNNAYGMGDLQTKVRGTEIFVTRYPAYNPEATGVAEAILKNLEEMGLPNQGVLTRYYGDDATDTYDDGTGWDYYAVNRHSTLKGIPSILIEHAYMDNEQDLEILRSEEKLIEMGQRNAQAIADYYGLVLEADLEFSGSVNVEQTADEWLDMTVFNTKAPFEIKDVYVNIWSQETDEASANEYRTLYDNGEWTTSINLKEASMIPGNYKADLYFVDENEVSYLARTMDFKVLENQNTVGVFNAEYIENSKRIKLTIKDVVLKDSNNKVTFEIFNSKTSQNAILQFEAEKNENMYWAEESASNLTTAGVYYVDAYLNFSDGQKVLLKRTEFKIAAQPVTGKVNADTLNVRSGAGTNYSKVGTVTQNTKVTIAAEVKGADGYVWYKISSPVSGYVRSDYIVKNATTGSTSGTTSGTTSTTKKTGTVTADVLNVRSGAGTNYSKQGTLTYGAKVEILSESGSWYKVKYTSSGVSKNGYVHKDYIKVTVTTVTPKPETESKPEATPEPTTPAEPAVVKGVVNCDALNVRSAASTSSSKIGMLYRNATVEIVSQSGVWYKVNCTINGSKKTGYVHSDYITKTTTGSSSTGTTAASKGIVNCDALNVRSSASTSGSKIGMLYRNATVEIVSQSGVWYKVNCTINGSKKTGYVHSDYITKAR